MTHQHGQFETSDGCSLYFEYTASQKDDTLVFLHGLGGDLSAWQDERVYLEGRHYATLALDLRGHGLSDRPENPSQYNIHRLSMDVKELLLHCNIPHAILIGHCYGGAVSLLSAMLYPSLVSKLVLIDSSCKPPEFSNLLPADSLSYRILKNLTPYLPTWHITGHRDFHSFQGSQDWDWRRLLSDIAHTSIRSYLLSADQFHHLNTTHEARQLLQRTLIIEGENDTITPQKASEELHHYIRHSYLKLLPRANHISVINNALEVAQQIETFVNHDHSS